MREAGIFMKVNAVFEGGGVKGIGLVGAICAAEKKGIQFHQTAGTSVGAIVAALLASGYTGEEMRDILLRTPFQTFIRKRWYHHVYVIGPVVRLLIKKGLYSGDPLEKWINNLLAKKGVYTFADLPKNALRIVTSDISEGKMLVLPGDIERYGIDPMKLSVAKAVLMSSSLPYFFDPVILRPRTRQYAFFRKPHFFVDGAILSNYPLWIFDRESGESNQTVPTIGFQLVGSKEPAPVVIRGPISMLYALFSTMLAAHDLRYIEKHNRFRTVKIVSDMVHTTEFNIGEDKLKQLFASGFQAGDDFFSRWSSVDYSAALGKWTDKKFPNGQKKAGTPKEPPAMKG
jgi:NTE family protein